MYRRYRHAQSSNRVHQSAHDSGRRCTCLYAYMLCNLCMVCVCVEGSPSLPYYFISIRQPSGTTQHVSSSSGIFSNSSVDTVREAANVLSQDTVAETEAQITTSNQSSLSCIWFVSSGLTVLPNIYSRYGLVTESMPNWYLMPVLNALNAPRANVSRPSCITSIA